MKATVNLNAYVCASLTLVGVLSKAAQAECGSHTIQVIHAAPCGILGIPTTVGLAINEQGWIAGYHRNCNADERPFVWYGSGAIVDIPVIPTIAGNWEGRAAGLDNAGRVVGWMQPTSSFTPRAFLYENGQASELPSLPTTNQRYAYAINEMNPPMIAGHQYNGNTGNPYAGVYVQNGTVTALSFDWAAKSVAFDVNDAGQVTGWAGPNFQNARAFVWQDGESQNLGLLPGGTISYGNAINNNGVVCGRGLMPVGRPPALKWRSFIYVSGEMIEIGALPFYVETLAEDMNDAGQIVGWCSGLSVPSVPPAFIWQNGVMKSLAELCPDAPINITRAYAINNKGQITGSGLNPDNRIVAYILSPPKRIPGDYNCDGLINVDDLLGLLQEWGPAIPGVHADFNNDGLINVDDLLITLQGWTLP